MIKDQRNSSQQNKDDCGEVAKEGRVYDSAGMYDNIDDRLEMYQIEDTEAKIILHIFKNELFGKANLRPSDTDMLQKSNVCWKEGQA